MIPINRDHSAFTRRLVSGWFTDKDLRAATDIVRPFYCDAMKLSCAAQRKRWANGQSS